jgi:hypothetical protein
MGSPIKENEVRLFGGSDVITEAETSANMFFS